MKAVASMVTPGNILADVGTDHGYVPIALVQQGKITKAIAMDINKGPLQRACEHIAEFQLEEYIETRLSDGVKKLKVGEVDSILIAGMGGELVIHILTDGMEVCRSVKEYTPVDVLNCPNCGSDNTHFNGGKCMNCGQIVSNLDGFYLIKFNSSSIEKEKMVWSLMNEKLSYEEAARIMGITRKQFDNLRLRLKKKIVFTIMGKDH